MDFFYRCKYCNCECSNENNRIDAMNWHTNNLYLDENAVCPECKIENWNDIFEGSYLTQYEHDDNLKAFLESKGGTLQQKAIFREKSHSFYHNYDEYKKFFISFYKLSPLKDKPPPQPKMLFVTLNPRLRTSSHIPPLQNIVKKIIQCKAITRYVYAYEWSDPDQENGLHCHLLLDGNIADITYHINRKDGYIQKNFDGLIHGPKNNKPRDYKCPLEWWDDKIAYMKGATHDLEKNVKKSKYSLLRKKYNLKDIYTNIECQDLNP